MSAQSFLGDLEAFQTERLSPILGAGRTSLAEDAPADPARLLLVALANELGVSELAAAWMPSTPELDVKLAFARQSGDEAGHFQLVEARLATLGHDLSSFAPPAEHPLFQYMRGLTSTVERVAAGLFTLEALAHGVNENFIALCERHGDAETARIYREYIQPDELAHGQLGRRLLEKYAATPAQQAAARATVGRVLELAAATRAKAAAKLGAACFPGC
jgi:hypothetical protein